MTKTDAKKGNDTARTPVELRGIGVSPGLAIGPAFLMAMDESAVVERSITEAAVEEEIARFEEALIETRRQLAEIQKNLMLRAAQSDASILDAHLMVLDDGMFLDGVIGKIGKERKCAEFAVREMAASYVAMLEGLEDVYLRERAVDIRDVGRRIIRSLRGDQEISLDGLVHRHIVVASDLAPSDTAMLRKDKVIGFATDLGSQTSHTAVMARALEIPAVVGLHDISSRVAADDELLIDGTRGVLIINPSAEHYEEYSRLMETRRSIREGLVNLKNRPAVTPDDRRVTLSANIEDVDEIDAVLAYGAEGVGLFRSEYLYMSRGRPVSEDEQAEVYTQVAAGLAPAPVIIRTLDIGGDKFYSKKEAHAEVNPFMGCRSIRMSLQNPEEFKRQLRAILRASALGNLKLMYPMISNVREIMHANALLEESKKELDARGQEYNPDIEVGVMVEIPAAALTAGIIAEHVDFFSLGTNDLIQYTIAVDRVNEKVAYLYEPTHPAVLKLIKETVDAGNAQGIWTGVCGEMAADPLMTPLLLGLGVSEFSVAPSAVPVVKDVIRSVRYSAARELAEKALSCKTAAEVLANCRKLTMEVAPELLELI